jgi:hypothetical protein
MPVAVISTSFLEVDFTVIFSTAKLSGRETEYSVMRTIKIRFFSWFSTRREAVVEVQPPLEHIAAQKDDLAQAGPNAVA